MTSNQPSRRLSQFFAGLTEQTFQSHLGVVDPPLIDYVTQLLLRYVRNDQTVPRSVTGRPLMDLTEMVQEATQRLGAAQRKIHCQIGDFALFWAGLFPEALRRKTPKANQDRFETYVVHGKRSYLVAAQIETDDDQAPPAELLVRLGERFELCAYGLREVRREWEERLGEGPDDLPLLFN